MSDRLLTLLGASDELEAVRVVEETNKFLDALKEVTGRDTFSGSLNVIKDSFAFGREVIEVCTPKDADKKLSSAESIGTLLAWKTSHEKLPGVVAENDTMKEKVRAVDVKRLIGLGLEAVRPGCNEYAGKLTPATAQLFENKSAEEVEAYLKVAPRVMPGERVAPPVETASAFKTNPQGRITDAQNRTYEEIQPSDRVTLKKNDPDLYDAMRADWENNGRPPGVLDIKHEVLSRV